MEKGDWEFKWDGIGRLGLLMLGSWEDENISWGKMKTRKIKRTHHSGICGGWLDVAHGDQLFFNIFRKSNLFLLSTGVCCLDL